MGQPTICKESTSWKHSPLTSIVFFWSVAKKDFTHPLRILNVPISVNATFS